MKYLPLILLICASAAFAQQRISSIRIPLSGATDAETIARLGFPLEEARVKPGHSIECWAGENDRRLLEAHGIAYTVVIPDWDAQYAERMRSERFPSERFPSVQSLPLSRVNHFHLGSLGGHLTLDELYAELDLMREAAPGLLSANDTIGTTHEGRPIVAVRLTASRDSAAPELLYTGLHHAREPEGMMTLVYFMWYLIEQYPVNPEISKLLDRAALCFVPVVNPDGYAYNQSLKPLGGGMWRKNRMPCGPAFGVDLNRNYGYKWAFDNSGSSADSSRETYRGKAAFSEAESAALRDYCNRHRFTYALNYHTFGDLLIFPWGYSDRDTKDSLAYRALSERLTAQNRYTWGTGRQTVNYVTNGGSDDWMYGDTALHAPIMAFTPEIGNALDNFWASPSRIVPLADDHLEANMQLAHMAVPAVRIASASVAEGMAGVTLALTLEGSTAAGRIDSLRVSVAGSLIAADPLVTDIPYPPPLPLPVRLDKIAGVTSGGERVRVGVVITTAESVIHDSVLLRIGTAQTLFADGAELSDAAWIMDGSWGRQACEKARGGFCYTESPHGNYTDMDSSFMTLRQPLDLRAYVAAELRFATRWRIESNADYGSVEASEDGERWVPLTGRYTSKGYGANKQVPADAPGYDGYRSTWAEESMDLTPWCGRDSVQLRFNFQSDDGAVFDGWQVDSIAVLAWQAAIAGVATEATPSVMTLSQNSPNPFTATTQIVYRLTHPSRVRIVLRDALGRALRTLVDAERDAGAYSLTIDGSLPPGVYLCTAEAVGACAREIATRKIVKLR